MSHYWVIGGEYADTGFTRIRGGGPEQRVGPFEDHERALAAWRERAFATVDEAHVRWRIEEEGDALPFWVVGGSYTDTSFRQAAHPAGQAWLGPFADYAAAEAEWRRLAWSTVDDALARFRIERRAAPPSGARPGRQA
jgi:hypothetical protein